MSVLILILIIISLWHVVYEAIVLPSVRMHLRNKFFALRDDLRRLKIDGIEDKDEEAFWLVHDGINSFVNRLHCTTLLNLYGVVNQLKHDEELNDRILNRLKVIRSCENEKIKKINKRAAKICSQAFRWNAGGWLIYIIPIIPWFSCAKLIRHLMKELIAASPQDTVRLIPVKNMHSNNARIVPNCI